MIYDKLRKLPKVIQMEIYQTGDITLLSDEEKPIVELAVLWLKLDEEFQRKYNKQGSDKIFDLNREIEYQQNRYFIINSCCEQLLFEKTPEVIEILIKENYKFDENAIDYKEQINKIHRGSKGILNKIKMLKDKLPKPKEENEEKDSIKNLFNIMAVQESILGYSFDYNKCTVEEFESRQDILQSKIKNIEKQIAQQKTKK